MDNSFDDLLALEVALQSAINFHIRINHIFYAHHIILETIRSLDHLTSWWFSSQISNLQFLLDMCNRPNIHVTPPAWLIPAINLPSIGFWYRHLNLFLVGRDLPYWMMRSFTEQGFIFQFCYSFILLVMYFCSLFSFGS